MLKYVLGKRFILDPWRQDL